MLGKVRKIVVIGGHDINWERLDMMLEEVITRSMSCGSFSGLYTAQLSGDYIIISVAFLISVLPSLTLCLMLNSTQKRKTDNRK
jgi:hypothetical protein